jgi:magnesium chelatase family protein
MLVAAMNPCPCGHLGDRVRECSCTPSQVRRYQAKASGPLLDRIDLHVDTPRVASEAVVDGGGGEPSSAVRARVERARRIQQERYARSSFRCNAHVPPRVLRRVASVDEPARALLRAAMDRLGLSARSHDRILRVARTIADLEGSEGITAAHVAEAIQYRSLDRRGWR